MDKDCVFCKIIGGEINSNRLYENDNFIVLEDIKPINLGHCLIIPKRHYVTILDMPSSLGIGVFDIVKEQALSLIKHKKAKGFKIIQNNFEAAGQAVKHVHFHLVPY